MAKINPVRPIDCTNNATVAAAAAYGVAVYLLDHGIDTLFSLIITDPLG